MYNGIGLSTVRGTATSGHVQRNASHVHASRRRTQTSRHVAGHRTGPQLVSAAAQSRGNREIQDHADRRGLENRLLVLREEWEARGVAEAEIVARLATERAASVASRNESAEATESVVLSPDTRSSVRSGVPGHLTRACRRDAVATTNTHVQKQAKAVENERLAAAFGISHVRHQEGAAFDRELQQAKKQERLARLEEERRVIEKAARKREKELRKAQKEAQRKQAKRKDDDSRSFYSSDDSRSSRSSRSSYSSGSSSFSSRSRSRGRRRKRSYSRSSSRSVSRSPPRRKRTRSLSPVVAEKNGSETISFSKEPISDAIDTSD
jgi:serine/arginine repetitive matrix protein 2